MTINVARRLFLAAGIFGLAVVTPLLFLENQIGEQDPPAITHPEFYYGFIFVTLAWQIVYLMLWRDPLRFRPMLLPASFGKAGFAISVFILFSQARMTLANVLLPSFDLVLAALFVWAYFNLERLAPGPVCAQAPRK